MFGNLAALLFRGVAADHVGEEPDRRKAERGLRLKLLMERQAPADILDELQSIFTEYFDEVLERVMDGELPAECLTTLRGCYAQIDKHFVLGAKAMQRLAEKRLLSAQIAARQPTTQEAAGA